MKKCLYTQHSVDYFYEFLGILVPCIMYAYEKDIDDSCVYKYC